MTIADMRILLGLGSDVSDAAVVAAYAASLDGVEDADVDQLPVTLEEAKRQLRITPSNVSKDAEVIGFIRDAAAWVEKYTGHVLVARVVQQVFDRFERLRLRAWPIAPAAIAVVSYETSAGLATVGGMRLLVANRSAVVRPPIGAAWPWLSAGAAVTVTVRAGYEPGEPIPGTLRRAMLVLISGFDEGGKAVAIAEEIARSICRHDRARSL